MLPKFGCLTNPTKDIVKEIEKIGKSGFDFVEINIEIPNGKPEIIIKRKAEIKRAIKKYNLSVISHTAWWMNFGSFYPAIRKAWIEEAKKAVRATKLLGSEYINFHAYAVGMPYKTKGYKKHALNIFAESMREIVSYAKKHGVKVMLENVPGVGFKEFKDFKYIIDKTQDLYVHLDVAHAFVIGGMKEIKKYIKRFRKKLVHIHISDNNGLEDQHIAIGQGKIDFQEVAKALKKINYQGTIGFEVFTDWNSVKKSMKNIRKTWWAT